MDQELKQYLEAMEGRLGSLMESLETRMESRMDSMETRMTAQMEAKVEKAETNLLGAFHGWARSMEIRVRGVATISTGFDERLALAEERISELERRRAS